MLTEFIEKLRNYSQEFKEQDRSLNRRNLAIFAPSLFFLCLAGLTLAVPSLVAAFAAALFISMGIIFAFIAWKFIQLRKRFNEVVSGYQDLVNKTATYNQSPASHPSIVEETEIVVEERKIILH